MNHSTLSIRCPHCKSKATTRSSREITPIYREVYLACQNILCGHTYKAAISVVSTISPSAIPDPAICIPLAEMTRARGLLGLAANDDHPTPANDPGTAIPSPTAIPNGAAEAGQVDSVADQVAGLIDEANALTC